MIWPSSLVGVMAMSISTSTKRAIGYFRVSSAKQTGERHSSLETQEARYRERCQRDGLRPVTTFTDVVTGRRDDRREYRRSSSLTGSAAIPVRSCAATGSLRSTASRSLPRMKTLAKS